MKELQGMRGISEIIEDGYCEFDNDLNVNFCNENFYRFLEISDSEVNELNLMDLFSEVDAQQIVEIFSKARDTGTTIRIPDLAIAVSEHGKNRFSVIVSVITDPIGAVRGFRTVWKDITHLKCLEKRVRQMSKMESLGYLVGRVAHDFNNLLTGIMGFSEILQQEMSAENPLRRKAAHIYGAAKRSADLTRQLLAFSRNRDPEMSAVDINTVILEMEPILARLMGEDIELVMLTKPVHPIRADRSQIEQILLNLAVNSRESMPNGGKLRISTSLINFADSPSGKQRDQKRDLHVRLTVSDDGTGIRPELVSKIFDPFFTTKMKDCNSGLGLYTVHEIMEQHGGRINVESEPYRGAVFSLYFPVAEGLSAQSLWEDDAKAPFGGNETVLVVEDEGIVLNLVCEALSALGYKTLAAREGSEAIKICREYSGLIHLLVSDVVLPRLNGPSLYERLSLIHPEMKVFYISGYSPNFKDYSADLEPCILAKPFTVASLAYKVRETLDLSEGALLSCNASMLG